MSSTPKELIFGEEARQKLKKGIDQLADIVGVTLSPKGKNIGLEEQWGAPTITNDGNHIVKDIKLKDPYANMGASMGKEVARKIKEKSGDGTTTGLILLRALVHHGVKSIASGVIPTHLKRGMEKGVAVVLDELDALSTEVKDPKAIENIATVSASGDREIGKMISDAIEKVGPSGVITVDEGKGTKTTLKIVKGMQWDRGYTSPYFCTNPESLTVEMTNTSILITDKRISSIQELLPLLQHIASTGENLLILAEDIDGDAHSTLVVNKLRGTLKVCSVKAPAFGDRRKALLEDIAILTGATVVSEEKGMKLEEANPDVLGKAEKIEITKETTTIINGSGDQKKIAGRIKQIDCELEKVTNDYDREKLQERRAKLKGGVGVIHVGGRTEPEMKQKKQVFEDSLNSTRAARKSGYLPGGGSALLRASQKIKDLKLPEEEQMGADIVLKACQAPVKQIIENCGKDPALVVEDILKKGSTFGFNATTGQVEDLLESQVIDPTLVVKNTLVYSASAAGIALISEALITNSTEEEESHT